MSDKPFPWRAVYKALVKCLGELADQDSAMPEVKVLAQMHTEVLDRGQRHDDD